MHQPVIGAQSPEQEYRALRVASDCRFTRRYENRNASLIPAWLFLSREQSLRREVFAHIARDTTLQHQVLLVFKKHPAQQRKVLMGLARNLQLRKNLLRVAGD